MSLEDIRVLSIRNDLINQLESIRDSADKLLRKISEDSEELTPTDGTVYGLIGMTAMAAVKNEATYNEIVRQIKSDKLLCKHIEEEK